MKQITQILILLASLFSPLFNTPLNAENPMQMYQAYGKMPSAQAGGNRSLVPDFASNPKGFGIRFQIEKYTGSKWQTVSMAHVFHSNDRLRFKFKTNGRCYLALLNNGRMIWPIFENTAENAAENNHAVPDNLFEDSGTGEITVGPFRVIPPAGRERNMLMISPVPFSCQTEKSNMGTFGSRTEIVNADSLAALGTSVQASGNNRDIVYNTQEDITYIVSNDIDPQKILLYEFDLQHE